MFTIKVAEELAKNHDIVIIRPTVNPATESITSKHSRVCYFVDYHLLNSISGPRNPNERSCRWIVQSVQGAWAQVSLCLHITRYYIEMGTRNYWTRLWFFLTCPEQIMITVTSGPIPPGKIGARCRAATKRCSAPFARVSIEFRILYFSKRITRQYRK